MKPLIKKKHPLIRLIEEGEGLRQDFKYEISDARKIARSFVAFANTEGGRLLIGVHDNGEIAGIRSEEERFMARRAASEFCRPQVAYSSREWRFKGKTVLEINIPKGNEMPYMAMNDDNRWRAWIRVGDQNVLANRVFVKAMQLKFSDKGTVITFNDREKILLEMFETYPSITLEKLTGESGLTDRQAEELLIRFLSIDLIKMAVDPDGNVTYSSAML
ncbi:MAG: ATP-binding protein [Bacteroidales bacterium]